MSEHQNEGIFIVNKFELELLVILFHQNPLVHFGPKVIYLFQAHWIQLSLHVAQYKMSNPVSKIPVLLIHKFECNWIIYTACRTSAWKFMQLVIKNTKINKHVNLKENNVMCFFLWPDYLTALKLFLSLTGHKPFKGIRNAITKSTPHQTARFAETWLACLTWLLMGVVSTLCLNIVHRYHNFQRS